MRLVDAVDIAKSCGLKTVKEAFANIDIHATMVFFYRDIETELNHLHAEVVELFDAFGVDPYSENDITIEEYEKFIGGIK